jgi:ADP-ribosyl-[dinitrogen reductase] hydrolase
MQVCCVYGQIAGACYGVENVPIRWVDGLSKKEMLDDFADRMVKMIGFAESQ